MQKYRCYGRDDLGYDYDALSVKDSDGDWYLASEADARIQELEKALQWAMNAFHCNKPTLIRGQNDAYFEQWTKARSLMDK